MVKHRLRFDSGRGTKSAHQWSLTVIPSMRFHMLKQPSTSTKGVLTKRALKRNSVTFDFMPLHIERSGEVLAAWAAFIVTRNPHGCWREV